MPFTIHTFPVGLLQANAYLLEWPDKRAILIDPGDGYEQLSTYIDENQIKLGYILLTHGHFDHTLCAAQLKEKTECAIYIYPEDAPYLSELTLNLASPQMCVGEYIPLSPDFTFEAHDVSELNIYGDIFKIIHTPGHTPGSTCFYMPDKQLLFSGDTLFVGGYGRTDLPGGSMKQLSDSLSKLFKLPGETYVYPGHGSGATMFEAMEAFR